MLVDPHTWQLVAALTAAAGLGLRHGFDYDHLAAISDIAGSQARPRTAMWMGTLYALGHAATVAALGGLAIGFRLTLPAASDRWFERLVGATLIVLGVYVLATWRSAWHQHHAGHRPQTRLTLLVNGILWLAWRVRQRFSRAPIPRRQVFANGYGQRSALLVGVIHGLGAETPTQLGLFLLTVQLGGVARGLLGLGLFCVGLLVMNTVMCAIATGVFGASVRRPHLLRWVSLLTAAYSLVIGGVFLLGGAGRLPPI